MSGDQSAPSYPGDELVHNVQLRTALDAELPDFELIKQLVAQAYTAETGQPATDKRVASWIRHAVQENPDFQGLITEPKTPRYVMFSDLAAKFEYLMKRPCNLCLPYQNVNFIRFMLHTAPLSQQVEKSGPFKKAVEDYLGRVKHDFTDFYDARLCVAITFALSTGGQSVDMDNLAKSLLDALQGYAYKNDKQIDHLDLVRARTGSSESFIGVRIAVTEISDNVDTIRPEFQVQWVPTLGVGPIDLTPYL